MYTVYVDDEALVQADALPATALNAYLEAQVVLETSPLSGRLLSPHKPNSNMRTLTFGPAGQGMLTYYVIEYRRLVVVVIVTWFG